MLLTFPEKAVGEPEALPILLGGALPSDISNQLRVSPHTQRNLDGLELIPPVPIVLGTRQSNNLGHVLPTSVSESSVPDSICYAGA